MKNTFLILLTVFITGTIFSQTSFLVVNEDKIPIDGAHVFRNQKLIGYTSKDGKFSMPNVSLGDTICFKFKEFTAIHVVSENTTKVTQLIEFSTSNDRINSKDDDVNIAPYPRDPVVPAVVKSKEDQIYFDTDEQARFPGGREELNKYLVKNLKYPENAITNNIQGKCYVRFVVKKNGQISDIKVTREVTNCPECSEEARRLVRNFPKWIPARRNGEVVRSYFDLPLNFQLN